MELVLRADSGGVASLVLNRPEARNALTTQLLVALLDQLRSIRDSPQVRAVILSGAAGTFCAGADLKEFGQAAADRGVAGRGEAAAGDEFQGRQRRIRLVREVFTQLRTLGQPTLAVVTGAAFGAGWGLSLACDLTVASRTARFCLPEVRKGFHLPAEIPHRLAELVGPMRAADIVLSGDERTADQGLAHGWVARLLPDDQSARAAATGWATALASYRPESVADSLQALRRGLTTQFPPVPNEEQHSDQADDRSR